MYNTSDNYKEKIRKCDLSNSNIKGTITLTSGEVIDIDSKNITNTGVTINRSCVYGTSLEIGSTIKNELTMSFRSDMSKVYDLLGATVELSFYLDEEEVPLGVYTVVEPERNGNIITIDCFDNMSKIDINAGNAGVNGTPYNILKWISRNTGVELKNTEEEILNMTNGNVVLNIGAGVFASFIEILSEVTKMLCAFATIDREGKLEICQYKTEPVITLYPDEIRSVKLADFKCKYTRLDAIINSISYTNEIAGEKGLRYAFESKIFNGTQAMVSRALNNILNDLSKIEYVPADISLFDDPSFDLGDMITIVADGDFVLEDINIVITSIDYRYNKGTEIDSTGENPYFQNNASTSYSSSGSTAAMAKYNSTYIATFENLEEYTIGSEERTISFIEYTNGANDICVVSGQACIDVTTPGTIQIHYYQNGEMNSFIPEQYLNTGKHILNFSCWFQTSSPNSLIPYEIRLNSTDGLTGTVAADKVRSYALGTTTSEGKFITDNVIYETISKRKYTNNLELLNYEKGEE